MSTREEHIKLQNKEYKGQITYLDFEDQAKLKQHLDIALIHLVNQNLSGYMVNLENMKDIIDQKVKQQAVTNKFISKLEN